MASGQSRQGPRNPDGTMIDNFSILLSHALILIMFWRLVHNVRTDIEEPPRPDEDAVGFAANIRRQRHSRKKADGPSDA